MTMRSLAAALLLGFAVVDGAGAQIRPGGEPPGERRQMLEQRLRDRTAEVVRNRLQLTDEQMARLQATTRQFEQQRAAHFERERGVRQELRREVVSGDSANQARVAQLLDQTLQLERQRLEIVQNEQRELAKFLTPVQRAKLLGLQNELRMRAQQMRGRGGPPRRGGMPPGGRPMMP